MNFVERSKLTGGIMGFFVLIVLVICIMTMSLCIGIKKSVKNVVAAKTDDMEVMATKEPAVYSAVLSGGKIYIYDAVGNIERIISAYAEFLTAEDRALLSRGIEFYSEEEMLAFMNDFDVTFRFSADCSSWWSSSVTFTPAEYKKLIEF